MDPLFALKGILSVCKFIGYKTCAKFASLTVGKKAMVYGAQYVLGDILPLRVIKHIVAAAPYAPAAVVLATGGTSAIVTNVTYIVISQLSDYLFVCAVRKAAWTGATTTYRVAKYVFITGPLGLVKGPLATLDKGATELCAGFAEDPDMDGWVLVDEEEISGETEEEGTQKKKVHPAVARGAIHQMLTTMKANANVNVNDGEVTTDEEITEEMVEANLIRVGKIAQELNPTEEVSGVEFVDAEGTMSEEAWNQSLMFETVETQESSLIFDKVDTQKESNLMFEKVDAFGSTFQKQNEKEKDEEEFVMV